MMAASVAGAADVLHGFIGSLSSLLRGVFGSALDRTAGQSLWGFMAAEPWIVGLLFTYVLLLILVVLTLDHEAVQAVLLITFAACIWNGDRLNAILGCNWQRFSKHNYFDEKGLFFSTLVSAPLALLATAVLVNLVAHNAKLMLNPKRAELGGDAKPSLQEETGAGGRDENSGPASRTRAARSKKKE